MEMILWKEGKFSSTSRECRLSYSEGEKEMGREGGEGGEGCGGGGVRRGSI